jgi:hypothetical protein
VLARRGQKFEIADPPHKPHATSHGAGTYAAKLAVHGAAVIAGTAPAMISGTAGRGCEFADPPHKPHATSYGAGTNAAKLAARGAAPPGRRRAGTVARPFSVAKSHARRKSPMQRPAVRVPKQPSWLMARPASRGRRGPGSTAWPLADAKSLRLRKKPMLSLPPGDCPGGPPEPAARGA